MDRIRIKGNRQYNQQVVGESNYQDILEEIAKTHGSRFIDNVELVLEDENKYDRNAVAVTVEGEIIGYLSKDDAVIYRQRLEDLGHHDAVGICGGKIIGGNEGKSFGFILDLDLNDFEVHSSYIPGVSPVNKTLSPGSSIDPQQSQPSKKRLPFFVILIISLGAFCVVSLCFSLAMDTLGFLPTSTPAFIQNTSAQPRTFTPVSSFDKTQIATLETLHITFTPISISGKSPELYRAEFGGNIEVYQNILSLSDCASLQKEFNQASENNKKETPGTAQFRWTLGYMTAANDQMKNINCY